ncbi:RnfABCDGE type electron transport complex subunit G [Maribacter polysaccharolyticus]|uniref:RnfABCDGE type electron transport complex subunit G n=1 Tax=Maribacter polysaccharolyticus TaxID=3020831 RepID=UPI00237F12EC|nr:RnfABCDGE type electron transport complex subunit G [Maribacter polysaccharolyticus]MDE3742823.1 RnfABCDGE type electron transport complex subunit G [Maribacter polysaccharolyticus]
MSKKESTFLNMALALIVITLVAGFSLGFVNDLTTGPKAAAKLAKKVNALKAVLPEFDNDLVSEVVKIKTPVAKDSLEIYPAFSNGEFVGAAVIGASEKGFSGLVKIMVGFTPDGSIQNVVVLEQKETPGLGTKMKDEKFIGQFRDKNPSNFNLKVSKDGGQVDALTGATISSRAFTEAAQSAYDEYILIKDSITKSKK